MPNDSSYKEGIFLKMKKLILSLLILMVIVIGVGLYIAPSIIASQISSALAKQMQTEAYVEDVDISFIDSYILIESIKIKDYPQFSDNNIFELKDLKIKINPKTITKKLIDLEELSAREVNLTLSGGIKENNFSHLKGILDKSASEQESKSKISKISEDSITKNLKIKIERLAFKEFNVNLKLKSPIDLPEQSFKLSGFEIKNIGGNEGVEISEAASAVTDRMKAAVDMGLNQVVPDYQKFLIDTQRSFSDNLEKSKEKASELFEKYF